MPSLDNSIKIEYILDRLPHLKKILCAGANPMSDDDAGALLRFISKEFDQNGDGRIDYPGNCIIH